jgi:dolichyl-diphosphooligosaccharide--protein glycosyltransferase
MSRNSVGRQVAPSKVSDTIKGLFSTEGKEALTSRFRGLKSVFSEVSKSTIIQFASLSIIVILAAVLRLMPLRWGVYLGEFDPYVQYRNTAYMVTNGFTSWFRWHDNMVWYPWGRDYVTSTYPGLAITGSILYMFVRSIGVDVTLLQFCIFFPVLFGSAAVVAIYLLGKEVWGKSVGLFSALFLAFSASEISRTSLGWYDDETVGIFSMILFFMFFLKAMSPNRSYRSCVIYATLSGLTLSYLAFAWGGFRYPMALMALFTFVLILVRRYSRRLLVTYSITYGLSFFIETQVPRLGYDFLSEISTMAVLGVFVLLCAAEIYTSVRDFRERILTTGIILGLLAVVAVVFYQLGLMVPLGGKFAAILDPAARLGLPIVESVAEHRPATWASFFYEFGITIFLGVFGLFFAAQRRRSSDIFMIVFGLTAVYFAGSLVRLTLVMAPAFCILSAITMVELGKPAVDILRETTIFPKRRIRYTTRVGKEFGVGIILILLLITMPTLYYATASAYTPATIVTSSIPITPKEGEEAKYSDWLEGLSWMQANLPENAVVFAWWDYGYWITQIADRRSMADNGTINSTQVAMIGCTFLSNETNALPMLQKYGVTHIAIFVTWTTNQQGTISYVGFGEDNKWYWMAKIGNGTTFEGQKFTFRELRSGQSVVYNRIITVGNKVVSNETVADSNGIRDNTMLGKLITMGINPSAQETSNYYTRVFTSQNKFVLLYEVSYLKASALTMRLSRSTVNYGENVTVSGELTEVGVGGLGDKIVFLAYSTDEGRTWNRLVGILTLPNGTYRYSWKPDGGSYIIRAVWDGEAGLYSGTTSEDQTLTVVREPSSITAKLSSTATKVGQPIKITSTLSVKSSFGTVTIEYSLDKQTWNTIASASPVQGAFSTEWTPQDAGTYYIRASWSGDAAYEGASSEILMLTVTT